MYLQPEVLEQALGAVLQNEIDVFGIVEEAIELKDIRVAHVHLQLYLPEDLFLHFCLLYFCLVHHLYRKDIPCRSLLGQVNITESTTAELLPQPEAVYR